MYLIVMFKINQMGHTHTFCLTYTALYTTKEPRQQYRVLLELSGTKPYVSWHYLDNMQGFTDDEKHVQIAHFQSHTSTGNRKQLWVVQRLLNDYAND